MKRIILFPALICIQGFTGCSNSNLLGNLDPGAKSQGADSHPEVVINDYHPLDLQSNFLAINGKSAAAGFSVALSAHGRSRNIHVYQLSSGNYAYDLDLDGEVDFQVQPLSRDYKRVNYLDENGKIFGKGSIQISGNRARLRFAPASPKNEMPRHKGETWRHCVKREWAEPETTATVLISPFLTPEMPALGPALIYGAICLDCLLEDPTEVIITHPIKPPKEAIPVIEEQEKSIVETPRKPTVEEKPTEKIDEHHDIRENRENQYKK